MEGVDKPSWAQSPDFQFLQEHVHCCSQAPLVCKRHKACWEGVHVASLNPQASAANHMLLQPPPGYSKKQQLYSLVSRRPAKGYMTVATDHNGQHTCAIFYSQKVSKTRIQALQVSPHPNCLLPSPKIKKKKKETTRPHRATGSAVHRYAQ